MIPMMMTSFSDDSPYSVWFVVFLTPHREAPFFGPTAFRLLPTGWLLLENDHFYDLMLLADKCLIWVLRGRRIR